MRRIINAVIGTSVLAALLGSISFLPWIVGEQWWRIITPPADRRAAAWFLGFFSLVGIFVLTKIANALGNEIGDPVVTKIEKVITERRQKKATPKEMQGAVSRTSDMEIKE